MQRATLSKSGFWEKPSDLPGVGPIIKVPSCQLMPHEGTFQLQTDLGTIYCYSLVTRSVSKHGENFKTFKYQCLN